MHIGMIVRDIDAALKVCSKLGFPPPGPPQASMQDTLIQFAKLGDFEIEFFQPGKPKNMLSDWLEKNGEGLHHIGFEVADVDAEAEKLKRAGIEPFYEIKGKSHILFYDPGSLAGMVIELVQRPK